MDITNNIPVVLAQTVELPDFSGLPPFAQGVMYTVAAIAVGLSIIIPRIGFMFGKKSDSKAEATPGIAAVIVDPTALNANTVAIQELAKVIDAAREELRVDRARQEGIRTKGGWSSP